MLTSTLGTREYQDRSSLQECAPQHRSGSVPATANRITCQVDQLDATVKELFERLSSVLSTHPGAGAVKDRDTKCSQPCELASHLDSTADRIASASMMLREIIDRLEV